MSGESNGRAVEPVDYAKLNAIYGVLFAGVLAGAYLREDAEDQIPMRELVPLGAATFALAKVIAREKIGSWVREPFVDDPDGERNPRGERLQRAVGELVTCTRCIGAWSALGIVGLRVIEPRAGRIVANVLAVSAANDWMQAGFKMLTSEVDKVEKHVAREDLELHERTA